MSRADGGRRGLEEHLRGYDGAAWARAVASLLPDIHPVDRTATRIWFAFFPLELAMALEGASDAGALAAELELEGRYRLAEQVDTSHRFLYGHRYWAEARQAVLEQAAEGPWPADLAAWIRRLAARAARRAGADESLLLGISAVALMTLRQVGLRTFAAAAGRTALDAALLRRTPEATLRARSRDDRQGLMGLLRGTEGYRYTVVFDESRRDGSFRLIRGQHLTTASMADQAPHSRLDSRCKAGEGPIPVQCRSAACGTCWVGVLAGAGKLSPMEGLERRRLRVFGYIDTDEPRPPIRLACQARAFGNVTIVVPPWNGVIGEWLRRRRGREAAAARAAAARPAARDGRG